MTNIFYSIELLSFFLLFSIIRHFLSPFTKDNHKGVEYLTAIIGHKMAFTITKIYKCPSKDEWIKKM
jgi:hypothetical protein